MPVHLRGYVEALGAGIPARPDDLLLRAPKRCGRENGVLDAGPLLRGFHTGHLRPRHHRRPAQGRPDDGQYPLPCCLMLSTIRSRWGQRLDQKKRQVRYWAKSTEKVLISQEIRTFWLRRQDSNLRPPGYEPDELPTALLRDIEFLRNLELRRIGKVSGL